ncbi:hypothetical protein [Frondihabitans australicus]|uniref:Uncharacterized protein n=1 Tax=Frondihabitans australicus TaxID=386892 RepID=A0A495IIL8_9MICO|nr:hypothetical protein [Frondihabitans australicus]RKR75141.1 hypothetical protein C8E83_2279 [Frondihabitans australicus]
MTKHMTVDDLYDLVEEHLGAIGSDFSYDSADQSVTCVLFETFELECGLEEPHGTFGATILLGRHRGASTFLGKPISLNSDPASIRASLDQIVDWCRLHLTDKFLAAFDAAHQR